jgi:DNA-binding protein YbaB
VSGLFNENGDLEALRVEKKADDLATFLADGRKLEVKGTVDIVDTGNMLFTYESGLVVNYMNAQIDNDLPSNPANWENLYVESKCDPEAPTFGGSCFNGTTLLATKVDNEAPEVADGLQAELEGIISDFNGQDDFKVSQVPVDAADASILCGNVALGNGLKVKVRGNVIKAADQNTVDASSVECRQAKTVRLEGTVQSNVNGTVTLLDVPVVTNDKTELDDLASVGDLVTDDAIEVRGFVDGNGNVIAVRLELEDSIDPDDFIVQAPKDQVTAVDQGSNKFTLLGVTVDTSVLQDDDFEGLNDLSIGRAAFYEALENGTAPAVKAKGTYDTNTNTLTAREVELEEND